MFAAAMRSTVREELRKTTAKVRESSVLCAVAAKWRSLPDTEKEHWKHKALRSSSPHHSHNSHNSTPQKHSHTSPQNASTLTPPQPKRPRKAPPAQHLLQNQEPQNSSYNPHDVLRPYTLTFYYPKGTRIQQQNSESQTDPEITQCTCSVDAEVSSDSTT
ncbi:hypothetical protein Pelo_2858 [Pelomyxa schiedti]|nr:hypothetical protein Pelo_2858 [Pelomyxa schiedti]